MTDLITVRSENGVNLVSARELHGFLEVQSKFADWIKNRIEKYGFEEGVDFTKVSEPSKILEGSRMVERLRDNYILKLDMAKELSMVENNEKGRQARKYFIECEKKLLASGSFAIQDPIARAKAWIKEQEAKLAIEKNLAKSQKQVAHKTEVITSLTEATKLMSQRQFLNDIIRMRVKYIKQRWELLYKEYERVNNMNLSIRLSGYVASHPGTKVKTKLDYIDDVMDDIPGLYAIAVKVFESDFKDNLEKYRAVL